MTILSLKYCGRVKMENAQLTLILLTCVSFINVMLDCFFVHVLFLIELSIA